MPIVPGLLTSIVTLRDAQRASALELLERVAAKSGRPSAGQLELIARTRAALSPELAQKGIWA